MRKGQTVSVKLQESPAGLQLLPGKQTYLNLNTKLMGALESPGVTCCHTDGKALI